MTHNVDAIYDQGVFRPLQPLVLTDGTRVHLHVEVESGVSKPQSTPAHVRSPRLANPELAIEFVMEVGELTSAGV